MRPTVGYSSRARANAEIKEAPADLDAFKSEKRDALRELKLIRSAKKFAKHRAVHITSASAGDLPAKGQNYE